MIWPSVAEERDMLLAARVPKSGIVPAWKSNGLALSIAFFAITFIGVVAFAALFQFTLAAGILCLIAAEVLILKLRFFGTGIELALWAVSIAIFIFELPHSGQVEGLLVVALGAAIVGLRLRNVFFGGAAAVIVIAYVAEKWRDSSLVATVGLAMALLCVIARLREWQRPSTDNLFAFIAVIAPLAGYTGAEIRYGGNANLGLAAAFAIFGAIAMTIGIVRRDRYTLISAALSIAIACVEARDLINAAYELKLIGAGALLVALGAALSRALRSKTSGFVITPTSSRYDEAIQIIGTINVAHASPTHTEPQRESGGGNFGGAGASGEY